MTLIQMHPRSADADPVHSTAAEDTDATGPRVCDDMSVEVALALMAAAHTGRLVVCDQDDQPIDLVTRTDLTTIRDSGARTDRVRLCDLRDFSGFRGTFAPPVTTMAYPSTRRAPLGSVLFPS